MDVTTGTASHLARDARQSHVRDAVTDIQGDNYTDASSVLRESHFSESAPIRCSACLRWAQRKQSATSSDTLAAVMKNALQWNDVLAQRSIGTICDVVCSCAG